MENYIGRLLDNRYEILEIIGMGGMAVVYKARDHRLKRLVAVKILKDEYSRDEDFRRRFTAESQAVAMLSHPNIVAVYDVNSSEGVDYIVMELIDGITLKQYMDRRGQLNWRETLHFSMQIAKALDHAHSRGIIHRDIKPHNIMILKDGSVKVADFGIARMTSAQNTLTREALGSVHYISPEQAKGGKVDCRTDIYSLGVVMYEMMTAKPPFDGDTPVSVAIQHISGTAETPRSLNPDIPEGMEQITMHAMTADLALRYASAADLLADLEEFRKNPAILFEFSRRAAETQNYPETEASAAGSSHTEQRVHDLSELYGDDPKPEKQKKDSVKRTGLILLLIIAISVVAVVVGFLLIKHLSGRDTEKKVPNFVGVYYGDIIPAKYPDFTFEAKEWVYSDEYELGYIIEQSPKAETSAESGTVISLTISYGKKSNKMPALVGDLAENATTMLDAMKLDLKIHFEYENSDLYDKGAVIRTDPEGGTALSKGQDITIYVSMGEDELPEETEQEEQPVSVPRLVGMKLNDAIVLLQSLGLKVESIKNVESDKEKDTIVSQSIPWSTEVAPGASVALQVSLGRTEEELPPEELPGEEEENPLDPNGEAPPPTEQQKTKMVLVKLPDPAVDSRKTVTVAILLNGEVSTDRVYENVPLADGSFPTELTGSGVMTMDVYIDGMFSYTEDVDFNG